MHWNWFVTAIQSKTQCQCPNHQVCRVKTVTMAHTAMSYIRQPQIERPKQSDKMIDQTIASEEVPIHTHTMNNNDTSPGSFVRSLFSFFLSQIHFNLWNAFQRENDYNIMHCLQFIYLVISLVTNVLPSHCMQRSYEQSFQVLPNWNRICVDGNWFLVYCPRCYRADVFSK